MKFPKDVILESVAEGRDHKEYGLEFVEMLGKDDAGCCEMVEIIFKYKGKYYSVEIQRLNGVNNFDSWGDEVECPEVVRKEVVHYYWEEVKEEPVLV